MNFHVPMESYELYSTSPPANAPIRPPAGYGWDLIAAFDGAGLDGLVLLWRRSRVHAAKENP
jgi:hypothetical protein